MVFIYFIYTCFFIIQVQPVAELVELSRRWAADGRQIRLNDVIAKGGTLRRTGSLRHRHTKVTLPPSTYLFHCFVLHSRLFCFVFFMEEGGDFYLVVLRVACNNRENGLFQNGSILST